MRFSFPVGWDVAQYDNFTFYRKQFLKVKESVKAVDLLAVAPDNTLWLIEVKDYGHKRREKTIDLADEIALKVFDTLAALLPTKLYSTQPAERTLAAQALNSKALRVVLHLELPEHPAKLWGKPIRPQDIQIKLRQKLKPIDPHPIVADSGSRALDWTVTRILFQTHGLV